MKTIGSRYKAWFSDKRYLGSIALGFGLLIVSLVANYYAAIYTTERASSSVADLILSNIPTFDVDAIFVFGPMIFAVIILVVCLADPRKIPFTLKSVALFILIRSFFITLTHIGPYPDHIVIDILHPGWVHTLTTDPNFFLANVFSAGADLFFSGHTGLPFLLGLLFWEHRVMRIFCIASAVFFGVIVLLGHLHYSIDVLSAFFITYSIYHIALRFFPRDKAWFEGKIGPARA
jgi:hypothetical protein